MDKTGTTETEYQNERLSKPIDNRTHRIIVSLMHPVSCRNMVLKTDAMLIHEGCPR
jgi:hypothetical protein